MQARLRSDRIHAAAVASLPYWEAELEKVKDAYEEHIQRLVSKMLSEKTWCGGCKWNEQSARKNVITKVIFSDTYRFNVHWEIQIEYAEVCINTVKRLIKLTSQETKPFPMLLSDDEYGKIWNEL